MAVTANNSLVAPGPQDELLRLTGSAGNPFEDVSATGAGTGKYYGGGITVRLRPVVGGTVSGTNPTLDVKLQDSADGVSYTDMGISFDQITATQVTAIGNLTGFPVRSVTMAEGRPFLRCFKTIGGTASPVFGGFALLHEPNRGGW